MPTDDYQTNEQETDAANTEKRLPTTNEVLAKCYELYQTDPDTCNALYAEFSAMQQDPASPYYAPYDSYTNRAIDKLNELGVDTSNINEDWYNSLSFLKGEYIYTANTNTLSSSMTGKRSTPAQKAAYYYDQTSKADGDTQKAKLEVQACKDEIYYLVGRDDLNLSDDDILKRLDIANNPAYSTMNKMDESRLAGTPIELNEAIGYNGENDIRTWIWQARNDGGAGLDFLDRISQGVGAGNQWQPNEEIAAKLDYTNPDTFSPYSVGMVGLDDAGAYFGRKSFDLQWLQDNQDLAYSDNPTDQKMFNKVRDAYKSTVNAKTEKEDLYKQLDSLLRTAKDPESVLKKIDWSDYPTLNKMNQSMWMEEMPGSGELVPTTEAVDYRYADVKQYIVDACEKNKNAVDAETYSNKLSDKVKDPVASGEVDAMTGADAKAPASSDSGTAVGEDEGVSADDGEAQKRYNNLKKEYDRLHEPGSFDRDDPLNFSSESSSGGGGSFGKGTPITDQEFVEKFDADYKGNIDLNNRPVVQNDDGTISTERSISFHDEDTGKEILIPTVVNGKIVSDDEAIDHYYETGEHLGMYDTVDEANAVGRALHDRQEIYYNTMSEPPSLPVITDQEKEIIKLQDQTLEEGTFMVDGVATDTEINTFQTTGTSMFDTTKQLVTDYRDFIMSNKKAQRNFLQNVGNETLKTHAEDSLGNFQVIYDHDKTEQDVASWKLQITNIENELGDKLYAGQTIKDVETITVETPAGPANVYLDYDAYSGTYIPRNEFEWADETQSDEDRGLTGMGQMERMEWVNANIYNSDQMLQATADLNEKAAAISKYTGEDVELTDDDRYLLQLHRTLELYVEDGENKLVSNRQEYEDSTRAFDEAQRNRDETMFLLRSNGLDTTKLEQEDAMVAYMTEFSNYEATVWSAYNASETYHVALLMGEDPTAVLGAAANANAENEAELEKALATKAYFEDNEIELPENYVTNLDRHINKLQEDIEDYNYFLLTQKDDFKDVSSTGKALYEEKLSDAIFTDMGWVNPHTNEYITNLDDYGEFLTSTERDIYYYMIGSGNEDGAKEYLSSLERMSDGVLHTRFTNALREQTTEFAQDKFLLANALAVVASPLSALSSLGYMAYSKFTGEELNPDNIMLFANNFKSTTREASAQSIAEACGEGTLQQKVVQGFYEIVTTRLDSMANMAVFGGMASGIGNEMLSEFISASPMGISAAMDTMADAKRRGATDGQAWSLGLVSFLAETGTEAISIDNISKAFGKGGDPTTTMRELLVNWLTSSGISEMVGETASDIITDFSDEKILKEISNHSDRVWKYRMAGKGPEEAEALAREEEFNNIKHTALISYLSPGADVISFAAGETNYYLNRSKQLQQSGINTSAWNEFQSDRKARQSAEDTGTGIANGEGPINPGAVDEMLARREARDQEAEIEANGIANGEGALNLDAMERRTSGEERAEAAGPEAPKAESVADYNMLATAKGADVATMTGTIASVLSTGTVESDMAANATAARISELFDDPLSEMQDLMLGAATDNIDETLVKQAIINAALAGDQSMAGKVMASEEYKNANPAEKATMLADTVSLDSKDGNVAGATYKSVREWRVSQKEAEIIRNSALGETNSEWEKAKQADRAAESAKRNLREAEEQLENRKADVTSAQEALQAASYEAIDDPNNHDKTVALNQAVAKLESATKVEQEYEQHLQNVEQTQRSKLEEAEKIKANAMASLRRQATEAVEAEDQQIAEAAAQAEEQARIAAEQEAQAQQEAEAAAAEKKAAEDELSRQAAIDKGKARGEERADLLGLKDEERDAFVQRYVDRATKAVESKANMDSAVTLDRDNQVTNAEGILALRSFENKTGLKITFEDLGDPTAVRGKYSNGVVTLNSQMANSGSMTTGQALVEAALHEITHAFEKTKSYVNYANTIKDILFGSKSATYENNAELRAAIEKKISDYKNAGIGLTKDEAEQEIVADYARTSELHSKNSVQRFVDNGLGGQMRNTLHNINQAIKNFMLTGEEKKTAENLRKAERAYQKALNELANTSLHSTGEQFSIPQFAQAAGLEFDEAEQTLKTKSGKVIDGVTTHVTSDMIKGTPMGRLIDGGIRAGTITEEDAGTIREQFAGLMDMCAKYRNSQMIWEIAASTLESEFSAIKGNSDKQYSTTVDFGTICTKTQAIVDQLSRNMLTVGRGLEIKEILAVYNDVYETNLTVPCPVCYVFSRWMGVPSLLGSMKSYQDRFLGKAGENLSAEEVQQRVDDYIANAQQNYGIDEDFGKIVADRKAGVQEKIDSQKLLITDLEAKVEAKKQVLEDKKAKGKSTKQAQKQLTSAENKVNEANSKLHDLETDLENVETKAYGKIINEKKSTIDGKVRDKFKQIEGDEGNEGLLKRIDDGKRSGKDVSALETKLNKLYDEIDDLKKQLSEVDAYNWVTQALCKLNDAGKFVVDFATAENPNGFVRTADEVLLDLNRTAEFAKDTKNWRYRTTRGAGMGKAILPYSGATIGDSVYGTASRRVVNSFLAAEEDTNAIDKSISSTINKVKAQNLIGGQRFQSTSDFRPEWGLDYVMTFIEQQVLGSKGQLYTKVAEAVPLFAKAGIDTNLSVMPYGDGYHIDENGNVVLDFSDVTGMNADLAKSLKDQYSNVQLILVGINDTHITAALKDSDITFVIPWHSSGNTKGQLTSMMASVKEQLNESSDYTKLQNDTKYEGEEATATRAHQKLNDGETLTQEEIGALNREANRNVREKILTGKYTKNSPSASDMRVINGSEYLKSLYTRFYEDTSSDCYHVVLTSSQASQIFPYEYWQTDTTKPGGRIETADENGRRFCEYCSELGYVPRFSGRDYEITGADGKTVKNEDGTTKKGNYGNFSGMTVNEDGSRTFEPVEGYWKLLIDRRMYDNDGNYRSQQTINVNGLDIGEMQMNDETGKYELTDSDLNRTDINPGNRSKYRQDDEQILQAHRKASEAFDKRMGITEAAYENDYQFSAYGEVTDADIDQDLAQMDRDYQSAGEQSETEQTISSERTNNQTANINYSEESSLTDTDIDQDLVTQGILTPEDVTADENAQYSAGGTPTDAEIDQILADAGLTDKQIRNLHLRNTATSAGKTGNGMRQFGSENGMLQQSDEISEAARQYVLANDRYNTDTNVEQINRAIDWIRKGRTEADPTGFNAALQKLLNGNVNVRSADGQARMVATMGMAVATNNTYAQVSLADAFNKQGTALGQALQARKLFKLMTPEGRISTLQNMLNNTQSELEAKGKNVELKFSDWIYKAAAAATEDGDFQKVQDAARQELSEQIPANWKDRLQGVRMLSMLGNPRTHVRNFLGNALFVPAVSIKNKLGAVAETITHQEERTKSLNPFSSKEVRDFARHDAITMKDELTGTSKYNESTTAKAEPFTGVMKTLADFNSNALEAEDWFFLKGHYRRALGGWITANGYTVEQLQNNSELLETGRAYAISEAQKATYRDFNGLAAKLNELTRNPQTTGQKALAFGVEAVLPFRKTPANILKRGLEYSPVGIARSLTADLYHLKQYNNAIKNGTTIPDGAITPNQFIDRACSSLTGTGIMAVGAFLASMGVATGGLGDDDDEFEKLKGNQKYSWKFNLLGQDVTFTMDWAAPMSMPFFVGAAIYDMSKDEKGFDINTLVNSMGNIAEPVFNLSMLDGVNSLLQTSQSDDSNLTQIIAKIITNYGTSYLPSVVGALTRTFFDDTSRKSFVKSGEGSGVMGTLRYTREQVENKIPGLSQTNIPIRDAWGNAKTSGLAERFLENFVLPGYVEQYNEDPVTNAMADLYQQTGATSVIPKEPAKTFSAGGQKYVLEAEQWDTYKAVRGQTAYAALDALIQTDEYQNASNATKIQMVEDVWEYANNKGKLAVDPSNKEQRITVNYAEMNKALDAGDYEAYETMIEALHEDGVEDSSIKTKIGNKYRDQYKDAYREGNYERMTEIEEILDNSGYSYKTSDWEKAVDKENE